MAFLRRFHTDLLAKDDVTGDTSVLGGANVNVLRGGAVLSASDNIPDTSSKTFTVYHPGQLRKAPGDAVRFFIDGSMSTKYTATITDIAYDATDDNWDITVTPASVDGGTMNWTAGDRLVLTVAAGAINLYNDETGQASADNPVESDANSGEATFYAKPPFVDLEITSGSDTRYVLGVHGEGERYPVTPQDFGAEGDGSTDDTLAVQAALHYVGDILGGGQVHIPGVGSNSYKLTLPLPVYSNMLITGEGFASHLNQTTSSEDVFAFSNKSYITFKDLAFTTVSGSAIDSDGGGANNVVTGCAFRVIAGQAAIDVDAGIAWRIDKNLFMQVADGVTLRGASVDNVITGNAFLECTGTTITTGASTQRNIISSNVLNSGTLPSVGGSANLEMWNTGDEAFANDTDISDVRLTIGQLRGTVQTETAVAALTADVDATVLTLNAGGGATLVQSIAGCAAGRFLVVTAHLDAGIDVTLEHNTTTTGTDDEFYLPGERDLQLGDGDSVTLVGRTDTFNGVSSTMWTVAGAARAPSFAQMYMATPGAGTSIGTTPAKETSGTAAAGANNTSDWIVTTGSGGSMAYDGSGLYPDRIFRVQLNLAFEYSTAGDTTAHVYIYKNAGVIAETEVQRDMTQNDIGSIGTSALVSMSQGDDLEVYLELDATKTAIIQTMQLSAVAVD